MLTLWEAFIILESVLNHAGVDIYKDEGFWLLPMKATSYPRSNIPHHIPFLNSETKHQSLWLINLSWLKLLFYFSTFVSSTFLCNLKVLCICVNLYGAVGTWWTWTGGNRHHLWRKSKSNWPKSKLLMVTLELTIKTNSNPIFSLADEAPILFL